MRWFLGPGARRRSIFNNLDAQGNLTCGRVTAHLYVGGQLGPRDLQALQDEGITVFINLQEEQQDVFAPHERIEGYLWLPAPDGLAPSLAQLRQGVDVISVAAQHNRKVFVHCKAGQGRAPLLCACYLITQGHSPLQAIAHVREARPRTLLTPEQGVRLREFATLHETLASDSQRTPQSTLSVAAPQSTLSAAPDDASQTPLPREHDSNGAGSLSRTPLSDRLKAVAEPSHPTLDKPLEG